MLQIINITNPEHYQSAVDQAAKTLRAGGIIIYPTETTYGIGADALNENAIKKVFELKKRVETKAFHVVVSDIHMAEKYVVVTKNALELAKKYLPGPLTLVLNKKTTLPALLTGSRPTLGIRIPDYRFCLDVAAAFGGPFTATSANISGAGDCYSLVDINSQFGTELQKIDLIVDGGVLPKVLPSTVVDATGEENIVLRAGPVKI